MKAGILFTGSGPIAILTSYRSLDDPELGKKLASKGIEKYIAYELSEELAREKYEVHYQVVMNDLYQEDDLRVLDYDGHHIFKTFRFAELGEPIFFDPKEVA